MAFAHRAWLLLKTYRLLWRTNRRRNAWVWRRYRRPCRRTDSNNSSLSHLPKDDKKSLKFFTDLQIRYNTVLNCLFLLHNGTPLFLSKNKKIRTNLNPPLNGNLLRADFIRLLNCSSNTQKRVEQQNPHFKPHFYGWNTCRRNSYPQTQLYGKDTVILCYNLCRSDIHFHVREGIMGKPSIIYIYPQ